MALLNGLEMAPDGSMSPTQHLGKRKRSSSFNEEVVTRSRSVSFDQDLKDAIQIVQGHNLSNIILQSPLSKREKDDSAIKRPKLDTGKDDKDNIKSRISSHAYTSLNDLLADVTEVRDSLNDDEMTTDDMSGSEPSAKSQIDSLLQTLSALQSTDSDALSPLSVVINGNTSETQKAPTLPPNQVLSLRSQTEQGIRQLFSGLPSSTNSSSVDGRRLPNGFELTEVLTIDRNNLQNKDIRRFGEVFASHRNAKMLEMPRASRLVRGNVLNFIAPLENVSASSKSDYRHSSLHTGLWLRYATSEKVKVESKDKSRDSLDKSGALFKGAFSSFAPSSDNTQSALTDYERSQQWWKKCGQVARADNDPSKNSTGDTSEVEPTDVVSDHDYERMIANFIPEDDLPAETEDLLGDISDLIQTLSSYQSLRNLEVARGPSSASKPSKDEQSVYELLHSQLQVLVSALPPFAVAKLNGDQLEDLNISTHIIVTPPEFIGTAQADDHTLRKNRAVQAVNSVSGRNQAPQQSRTGYGTPAAAYNAQARAYNSIPSSAYTGRPAGLPMYNTPRPPVPTPNSTYAQSQYRSTGPAIHTPSVQQFQRPLVNGYSSTVVPTPTPASAYMQRPSQPSYQQRAQDSVTYNRVDLSNKSTANGDASQQQRSQYTNVSNNDTPSSAPSGLVVQQRMTTDVNKQQHPSNNAQQPLGETIHAISPVGS